MPSDYISKIGTVSTSDLLRMLEALEKGKSLRGWLPGKAFEYIVLRAFSLEGAIVTWPFSVTLSGRVIEQIDGAAYFGGLSCLVETKDYGDPLNIEPVAKLRSQLTRRPSGTLGLIFTTSGFSEPAKSLTRMMSPLNVLLWDYQELKFGIEKRVMCSGLTTKYMNAVERGMPDYDIRKGLR